MGRLKLILRVVGVLCFVLGLSFIPHGYGINPKRDSQSFNNLVELGLFSKTGVPLMAIGAAVFLISLLLPGEPE